MKQPRWTPEQVETAKRLVEQRASDEECIAAVGRNYHACYSRVYREPVPQVMKPEPRPEIPCTALVEAARRLKAPRSITAWICGDPAPGFSALDRREM